MIYKAASLAKDFNVTFLSMENDKEAVIRKLFVESRPYSDYLKRLMVVMKKDCLDPSKHQYQTLIDEVSVSKLKEDGYIKFVPILPFLEFENSKSYLFIRFRDVAPTTNPQYTNTTMEIICISNFDNWELDNYAIRPWKMAGYVNGILNNTKLSGIGTLQFAGASEFSWDENWGGVLLTYIATHSTDDQERISEESGIVDEL